MAVKKKVSKKITKKVLPPKAPVPKGVAKKPLAVKTPKVEPVAVEEPKKAPVARRRKVPSKIAEDTVTFLDKGEISFAISDSLRDRFHVVHLAMGNENVLDTLTSLFERGLQLHEAAVIGGVKPEDIDDALVSREVDENLEPYGVEFDAAYNQHLASSFQVAW